MTISARWVRIAAAAAVSWAFAMPAGGVVAQPVKGEARPAKSAQGKNQTETGSLAVPPQAGGAATAGQPADPHVAYYLQIALVQGHLLVANELVQEGRWDEALPHVLRPLEQIHGQMLPYMKSHGIAPFESQLKTLVKAVTGRNKEAYDAARLFVQMRLDRALDGARKSMTPMRSYTLKTIVEVLRVAQAEYAAALGEGKIENVLAYQEGRGFVYQAHQMFESLASDLEAVDSKAVDDLRWAFVEIKTAWPTPMPPAKVAMTLGAVSVRVNRVAEIVAKLE